VSTIHKWLAPEFDPVFRAATITGIVIILDVAVVAPVFEHSHAMFCSFVGTWIPFAAIARELGSWSSGASIATTYFPYAGRMSGSIDERGVSPRTGTTTRVFTFC
jgi:hypothetical protein